MKKRQIFIFLFAFISFFPSLWADEDVKIISRKEWGADETLKYISSPEWQEIIKKREENALLPLTDEQKKEVAKIQKRNMQIAEYFDKNFPEEEHVVEKISYENGEKLAWPIKKTNYVKWIIVHHTDTSYPDDITALKEIYHFHSVTRGWWDIGYNYLIGENGDIYEWRSGWDYAEWAHAVYNNFSSVSISMIGKFDDVWVNERQYAALSKMILYLSKKYGIDLNKKVYFHKECKWEKCSGPMDSFLSYPVIGHRDVGYTKCPWDKLYEQIHLALAENQPQTKWFTQISYEESKKMKLAFSLASWKTQQQLLAKVFSSKSQDELLNLLEQVEEKLFFGKDKKSEKQLTFLKSALINYFKNASTIMEDTHKSFDDTHPIKILLSYPKSSSIKIKDGSKEYTFTTDKGALSIEWKRFKRLELSSKKLPYLEISSWERIPEWDKKKEYNDNTFRGSLILQVKNGNIEVINKLSLSDYLKWLWEVSNTDEPEKIKAITIAARSYARYYMTQEKKFPSEEYDGSDNPDEFQKYLWYGYEIRSPQISKMADSTKNDIFSCL